MASLFRPPPFHQTWVFTFQTPFRLTSTLAVDSRSVLSDGLSHQKHSIGPLCLRVSRLPNSQTNLRENFAKQAYPGVLQSHYDTGHTVRTTEDETKSPATKSRLTTPHARQATLPPIGSILAQEAQERYPRLDPLRLHWASLHTNLCPAVEPRHRWCPHDFSHSIQLHTTTSLFPTLPPTPELHLTSLKPLFSSLSAHVS